MLAKGFIRPSLSPTASPILFVLKDNNPIALRLYINYRKLNDIIIKNKYPFPLINETLRQIAGVKYFTRLNLYHAYYLIRIREGDKWKTVFRIKYNLFKYLVIPFGLTNTPATM